MLAAELFNTAIESLADHLHPEQHPAIKVVKDCAAGAVLVASVAALGVAAAFVYDLLLALSASAAQVDRVADGDSVGRGKSSNLAR